MRKLMVFLAIVALLAMACTPKDPRGPTDPFIPDPGPVEPDPGPQDPDPKGGEEDPPDPGPGQAQIIWQTVSPPSYFHDIPHGEETILYFALGTISAQNLEDGSTVWTRDFAREGFEFSDILAYETKPLIREGTLSYPLSKGDKAYIEQLDIATGEVLWRLEAGSEDEVSFQWDGELVKISAGYDEGMTYYDISSGNHLPFLDGSTAYMHQGSYYTFSQAKPYDVAKYDDTGQGLWRTTIEEQFSYPYLREIWCQGNTLILNIIDFAGDDVQYFTLAVDDLEGIVRWTKAGTMANTGEDSIVIVDHGKATLVDATNGQELQVLANDSDVGANSFVWKGCLYVTGTTLKKIDLGSGEEVWRQNMPGRIDLYSGVTAKDNLREMDIMWSLLELPIESEYLEEELLAIDPSTGNTLASYPFIVLPGGPESWPIKLTKDSRGHSYIMLEVQDPESLSERSLLLIDAHTGEELWEYQYPKDYNEVNVLFSESDNLVVVLWNYSSQAEVLYLAKHTGHRVHHFQTKGYPSLMVGDRILMNMPANQTALIAPPN